MMRKLIRKITETVYLAYARLKSTEEIIDVRDYLSQILTLLIIAPERLEENRAASRFIEELREVFGETHFYLLEAHSATGNEAPAENLQVLTYGQAQIAFHGLPKKELRDTIRARHFDLVIDLNYDFSLVATALCLASNAKMRVCLQHPKRDSLYNFQVRAANHNDLEAKYDSLIKYLTVFKSLPDAPSRDLMPV